MPCGTEISSVVKLIGCPGASEYFFMVGATGGDGPGGYALRSAAEVKSCFLGGLSFGFVQIVVGVTEDPDGNIIMNDQSTQLVVDQAGILGSSVFITTGTELPREGDGVNQIYYGDPQITSTNMTVNFIQSFGNQTVLIVHYAYIN